MFEKLEESFKLLDANLLKNDLNDEEIKGISNYVGYCQEKLEYLISEINSLQESDEKVKNLELLEDIYEEKILYLLHDITTEMFNLQAFLVPLKETNEKINTVLEDIDGVEALLMLIPEEIEKIKCLMVAFLN